MKRKLAACFALVLALGVASCSWLGWGKAAVSGQAPVSVQHGQRTLRAFQRRIAHARADLPNVILAAQAVADRMIEQPDTLIDVPYGPQETFAEELLNRSGGLAVALPSVERRKEITDHDVLLFSVRSWEKNGEQAGKILAEAREKGALIVMFASKAGAPGDLDVDFLIDNGASGGGEDEAAVNALGNDLNSWLWCCEYASALTRRGRSPGILMSALRPGADEHNKKLQSRQGRHWMGECETPVEVGALAGIYLARAEELVQSLAGKRTQTQLGCAANTISRRIAAGGKVMAANCTHFLLFDIELNHRTPWRPFYVVWRAKTAFPANLHEGDLLLWFSFKGLSTPYEDYGKYIRESAADVITCYKQDEDASNNLADPLCHIDQTWGPKDAEVPVPFPPGDMAPISGINQGLLYRMLDEATVSLLAAEFARLATE